MHKSRSEYRDGYKAHIAIEPETGLVTASTLTPANAPDGQTGVVLLADEEPGLQILADGAYGSGETLNALGAPNTNGPSNRGRQHRPFRRLPTRGLHRGRISEDRHFPCRPHGLDYPEAACHLWSSVSGVPTSGAVHHLQRRSVPPFNLHDDELVESRRAWKAATSLRTTDDGARWWSDRSPGWSPTTTGG